MSIQNFPSFGGTGGGSAPSPTVSPNSQTEVTAGTKVINKYVQPDTLKVELDKKADAFDSSSFKAVGDENTIGVNVSDNTLQKLANKINAYTATIPSILNSVSLVDGGNLAEKQALFPAVTVDDLLFEFKKDDGGFTYIATPLDKFVDTSAIKSISFKGGVGGTNQYKLALINILGTEILLDVSRLVLPDGDLNELVTGAEQAKKNWDAKTLNAGIKNIIHSLKFWKPDIATYGDGSIAINRDDERIVIDSSDNKIYKAIVDSIPINKQPSLNPSFWKVEATSDERSIEQEGSTLASTVATTLPNGETILQWLKKPIVIGEHTRGLKTSLRSDMTLAEVKTALGTTSDIVFNPYTGSASMNPAIFKAGRYRIYNSQIAGELFVIEELVPHNSNSMSRFVAVTYPTLSATMAVTLQNGETVLDFLSNPLVINEQPRVLFTRLKSDTLLADVKTALGGYTGNIALRDISGTTKSDPRVFEKGYYQIINQSTTGQNWLFDQVTADRSGVIGTKQSLQLVKKITTNFNSGNGNTLTLNEDLTNIDIIGFELADNVGGVPIKPQDLHYINIADLADGAYFHMWNHDTAYILAHIFDRVTGAITFDVERGRDAIVKTVYLLSYGANGYVVPVGTTVATERTLTITSPSATATETSPTVFEDVYTSHKVTVSSGKAIAVNTTTDCKVNIIDAVNGDFSIIATGISPTVTFDEILPPSSSYSTSEQLTNEKWIDGKPIYRRTLTDAINYQGNVNVFNFPIDSLIKHEGGIISDNGTFMPLGFYDGSSRSEYWHNGAGIGIRVTWGGVSSAALALTFYYTKP